jgi:hypothetical protein
VWVFELSCIFFKFLKTFMSLTSTPYQVVIKQYSSNNSFCIHFQPHSHVKVNTEVVRVAEVLIHFFYWDLEVGDFWYIGHFVISKRGPSMPSLGVPSCLRFMRVNQVRCVSRATPCCPAVPPGPVPLWAVLDRPLDASCSLCAA